MLLRLLEKYLFLYGLNIETPSIKFFCCQSKADENNDLNITFFCLVFADAASFVKNQEVCLENELICIGFA